MAELEGKWVTINGAHVFVSSRGDVVMGLGAPLSQGARHYMDSLVEKNAKITEEKTGDKKAALAKKRYMREMLDSLEEKYNELMAKADKNGQSEYEGFTDNIENNLIKENRQLLFNTQKFKDTMGNEWDSEYHDTYVDYERALREKMAKKYGRKL